MWFFSVTFKPSIVCVVNIQLAKIDCWLWGRGVRVVMCLWWTGRCQSLCINRNSSLGSAQPFPHRPVWFIILLMVVSVWELQQFNLSINKVSRCSQVSLSLSIAFISVFINSSGKCNCRLSFLALGKNIHVCMNNFWPYNIYCVTSLCVLH